MNNKLANGPISKIVKRLFDVDLIPVQEKILSDLIDAEGTTLLIMPQGSGRNVILSIYGILEILQKKTNIIVVSQTFMCSKKPIVEAEKYICNSPIKHDTYHHADSWSLKIKDSTFMAIPLGNCTRIRGKGCNQLISLEASNIIYNEFYQQVKSELSVAKENSMKFILTDYPESITRPEFRKDAEKFVDNWIEVRHKDFPKGWFY